MAVKTFKRGLRVPARKHATEGRPAETVPAPKQVVIPINQHFGAPNKSLVAVGDQVKRGQKIADAASPGPMTVPVHASIAGVVKKIEPRTQSNNTDGPCIVIEADEAVSGDDFLPPLDIGVCSKEDALARIREAGIVGMGGAGFPAHIKLAPNKPVDTVIANAAECEPYLTTDEALLEEKTQLLVQGIAIVMKIAGVNRAIIGMEDNKASLLPRLEAAIKEVPHPGTIEVVLCKTRYPQGGEKMLITATTGREVPSGGLPADAGCIVSNVGTLVAVAEAFTLGKPLIERGLTVSGAACKTPKNIYAPIGTLLTDLPPEFMDIDHDRVRKILFGGPMMGTAVSAAGIPIQKNTSGIVFMDAKETYADREGPCIRCGRCLRNCPMKLSPVLMNNALEAEDLDEAVRCGLMDCIECGGCTFICPARIRLVQRFRVGKGRLRAKQALLAARQKAAEEAAKARLSAGGAGPATT
ncbi:MAG: electron transport complex subunit RsxC [Spirochaetaceae bacterium]|jgi:electron transport complex protein RnfC|nr:electron transport complex subunit RsxC [Spirochaetaceae bacterium]